MLSSSSLYYLLLSSQHSRKRNIKCRQQTSACRIFKIKCIVTGKINMSKLSRSFGIWIDLEIIWVNFSMIGLCQIPGWEQIKGMWWDKIAQNSLLELRTWLQSTSWMWMVGIVSTTARLYFWTEVSEAEGGNQQPKYLKAVLYWVPISKCWLPALWWGDENVPGLIRFWSLPVPSVFLF